jgi:hypothetical protein
MGGMYGRDVWEGCMGGMGEWDVWWRVRRRCKNIFEG